MEYQKQDILPRYRGLLNTIVQVSFVVRLKVTFPKSKTC